MTYAASSPFSFCRCNRAFCHLIFGRFRSRHHRLGSTLLAAWDRAIFHQCLSCAGNRPNHYAVSCKWAFLDSAATVARFCEVVLLALGTVLTSMVLFGFHGFSAATTPALLYAPIPLLLWATVRYGTGGLSLSLLGIALISTWYVMQGREPFPYASWHRTPVSLQVLLCTVAVPLMFLSAVLADGRRTYASLRLVSGRLIEAQSKNAPGSGENSTMTLHNDLG